MKKCVIVLLFLPVGLTAQNKRTVKPGWRSIATAGATVGESGAKPVYQLSGGITYGRFFNGIGMGYDLYEVNSFPVFADWRMSLGKQQLVFVYAMPGYNIPGKFKKVVSDFTSFTERRTGGLYLDAGLGCRFPLDTWNRLSISAGYARKSFAIKKTYPNPCGSFPCPNSVPETFFKRYGYGLLTTKLSWELGR